MKDLFVLYNVILQLLYLFLQTPRTGLQVKEIRKVMPLTIFIISYSYLQNNKERKVWKDDKDKYLMSLPTFAGHIDLLFPIQAGSFLLVSGSWWLVFLVARGQQFLSLPEQLQEPIRQEHTPFPLLYNNLFLQDHPKIKRILNEKIRN